VRLHLPTTKLGGMWDVQLAYKMLRDPHFQIATETKTILIIALLGRVSDMDVGRAALHTLIGVTPGQSRGMLLSHSLSAGDLSLACRGVKGTAETPPNHLHALIH
jgi:hypothetical protein